MYPTPARLNGYDPYTYFKDVLTRLLMQRVSEITQILCITGRLYRDAFLEKPMLTDDH
ncbi:transposase domain-containing protein [Pseudomonas umsongensis]|uniref:transposase domain-containing protein n=1 Tax=Pseudomonas umsongensis TaxID=198618 RepID=UPI001CDC1897|nr:transposase domain-containing protein [Pseudomonas umsongensis]